MPRRTHCVSEVKLSGQFEIMVVDDNQDNLATLESILSESGYKVRPAVNGQLAIQSACSRKPDLILLDIKMPGKDGYQICHELKADVETSKIPVLFISALDTPTDKVKAFNAGGLDFITKPFHPEEVVARIHTHLSLSRMQAKLKSQNHLLEKEIAERKQAEDKLQEARLHLEETVEKRTAALAEANRSLIVEIEERKRAESIRKKLERQIRQTEKLEAIGSLARGIAHDFKNITGAIIGCTELAMETIPETSIARKDLDKVREAGYRAKKLVEQIMTFSRENKGKTEPVNLYGLTDETIGFIRKILPENIQVQKIFDRPFGTVLADPGQIQQVLVNLCTNAAHAMEEKGGTLSVQIEKPETIFSPDIQDKKKRYFKLSVKDEGYGIDDMIMDRIFDPFFTTKKKNEGTGLGLSVVHGIVKGAGGFVTVESPGDHGTTVTVFLPENEAAT